MTNLNVIMSTSNMTVMSEYIPEPRKESEYQSEQDLENQLISNLKSQGIPYLDIHNEKELIDNLRIQLEKLNNYQFTNNEWDSFFHSVLANSNDGIKEKSKLIQQNHIHELTCDDGKLLNIKLIDKEDVMNNSVQVINQYETDAGAYKNRYDVTLLVNGLPMVHIELKRRGVAIREAFNQINRYQRDSFWSGSGLFEYIQIFVISNGTHTKYYSNTTRKSHISDMAQRSEANKQKTSNSFKFTSYWADAKNKVILDLVDFTKTFFTKHTLLNVITKYCVFTSEDMLLVMRPYQIVAAEQIINRIIISSNYKKQGTLDAGGYIWHTTGSGKTLTSFKTAQLASKLPMIDKVLFVVDRKDLDYQTMKEYDRFEKGAANGNKSTRILQRQLENDRTRIIVTTIQKLSRFIDKNEAHPSYHKHIVFIFDECHRSQFGDMHRGIVKKFKNYHMFGFTGTPIFAQNASKGKYQDIQTTAQAFGDRLHTYTIVDAINDENVLPFRIDYINTMKEKNIADKQIQAIDTASALESPQRIHDIVKYIIEHFDQKTKRNGQSYAYSKLANIKDVAKKQGSVEEMRQKVRLSGFNSIFAVDSIPMAKKYYLEFKKQIQETNANLKVAIIYSFNPNEEDPDSFFSDEDFDTSELDKNSRDFLEDAIKDYNIMFHTNYNTSEEEFQNYYKDVSLRMKNREIDLLIVVNMFLTGFDATTLNTLWVDKNLKQHGLIQAFSRTNRILNSIKSYGNIVCFRNLEKETEEAIALFGDKDAESIILLKTFKDYYEGYKDNKGKDVPGYRELVEKLIEQFPLGQQIIGESNQKSFVSLFGTILRVMNILSAFDDFEGKELLNEFDFSDYKSMYIDIYDALRPDNSKNKENIVDDIEFEIELIKQIEVNIDYILGLVEKYHESNCEDKEIIITINKAIDSSFKLRSKKDLIMNFIDKVNTDKPIGEDWKEYVSIKQKEELDNIIQEERLNPDKTITLIDNAFKDGYLRTSGSDIDSILPPMSRFGGKRKLIKDKVTEKLKLFFERYFDI